MYRVQQGEESMKVTFFICNIWIIPNFNARRVKVH